MTKLREMWQLTISGISKFYIIYYIKIYIFVYKYIYVFINGPVFLDRYSCLGNPMDRGAWWAAIPWGHRRVKHDLTFKHHQQP